jgi:type II secretory pathway component GspD/PulD (secretin)
MWTLSEVLVMSRKMVGLAFCFALLLSAIPLFAQASMSQAAGVTSPPLTLNADNLDIREFFRLLHSQFGVNILIAPDVNGRVTAFLNNVPWKQALDEVLKANNLVSVWDGDVLRIMTAEGAGREEAAAPVETCTYIPSHAFAEDIAQALSPILSPKGRISVETHTNTIIVRDKISVLRQLGLYPASPSHGKCSVVTPEPGAKL